MLGSNGDIRSELPPVEILSSVQAFSSADIRRYTAAFQRVGAVYDESIVLLNEFVHEGDWAIVKKKVLHENLLKKNSSTWSENILRTVKNRFLRGSEVLPNGRQISKFVSSNISRYSKIQALYQYVCSSDSLVDRLIIELVAPPLMKYGVSRLTKQMYHDFWEKECQNHSELQAWASSVSGTWQRKFFAFLRASGIMEKAPSVRIRKPVIRVEPFTFFLYGLLDKRVSGLEAIRNSLWKRYFMSEEDVEYALSSAQERGWLQYRRMGSIVELTTSYRPLEGWLNGALG